MGSKMESFIGVVTKVPQNWIMCYVL